MWLVNLHAGSLDKPCMHYTCLIRASRTAHAQIAKVGRTASGSRLKQTHNHQHHKARHTRELLHIKSALKGTYNIGRWKSQVQLFVTTEFNAGISILDQESVNP